MNGPRLILASASRSRQAMLDAAGVPFESIAPSVDEEAVKTAFLAEGARPRAIADALAELKALRISARRPDDWVLGADQVLACEGRLFSKAESMEEAREILRALKGRPHQLITAAVLARNGTAVWRHLETSELWMRDFSDGFLKTYMAAEGERLLQTVGCYFIEGRGAQLFAKISGDPFAIRGLPLLPLIEALRENGILPA